MKGNKKPIETFDISTGSGTSFENISDHVSRAVRDMGAKYGLCCVYVPHTTAAVTINENADPSVCSDMIMELDKIVPLRDGYSHVEGNSAAHLKSTIVGESVTIPIDRGELCLGTWQGIYFCEFDGPRKRKFHVFVQ